MDVRLPSDIERVVREYKGDPWILENALGAYVVAQFYGWRVFRLLHANRLTVRKYEKVLGVRFEDVCPERTELSTKCRGIRIADRVGAFWRVVRGEAPEADSARRMFTPVHDGQGSLDL